jgi:mitochondrial fission protein ELM1
VFPAQATPPDWLEEQLTQAGEVWVTPDSVSMVYEALTAGCRVGLFDLPSRPGSRVAKGVKDLLAQGYVSLFPEKKAPGGSGQAAVHLNEAGRCAKVILEKWFP